MKRFCEFFIIVPWKKVKSDYDGGVLFDSHMHHYSTNAKNRKLKKQILNFLSRIGFGAGKLPISGRSILLFSVLLFTTLFLPWVQLESLHTNEVQTYGAFSAYAGYIGVGIFLSTAIILFFLLSHTKKERVRSYVPFRLSDTQAVVFVASMLLVAIIQLFITSGTFNKIASVSLKVGFSMAGASVVCILVAGYFLSRSIKAENTEAYYLHHETENILGEYKDIIHPNEKLISDKKKENMSLPI